MSFPLMKAMAGAGAVVTIGSLWLAARPKSDAHTYPVMNDIQSNVNAFDTRSSLGMNINNYQNKKSSSWYSDMEHVSFMPR